MSELLFLPDTTHVEVECWSCHHVVVLRKDDPSAKMSLDEFEGRAICGECGTKWPYVRRYPKKPSRWGLGG